MADKIHTNDAADSDTQILKTWETPSVKRMRAGDAEDGYDPIVPDGGITYS